MKVRQAKLWDAERLLSDARGEISVLLLAPEGMFPEPALSRIKRACAQIDAARDAIFDSAVPPPKKKKHPGKRPCRKPVPERIVCEKGVGIECPCRDCSP